MVVVVVHNKINIKFFFSSRNLELLNKPRETIVMRILISKPIIGF